MAMPQTLLSRAPDKTAPTLTAMGRFSLRLGRLHEVCGTSRRTFALWVATQGTGPILWVTPEWEVSQLHGNGVLPWINPGRLIFVRPKRAEDILWTMEETLRSGAVALVVGDVPGLPGLTAVRRMHLAAETGAQIGIHAPLGLLLTPGDGGAQGVESRWHMAPHHGTGQSAWHLERRRARTAPPQKWSVTQGNTDVKNTQTLDIKEL